MSGIARRLRYEKRSARNVSASASAVASLFAWSRIIDEKPEHVCF